MSERFVFGSSEAIQSLRSRIFDVSSSGLSHRSAKKKSSKVARALSKKDESSLPASPSKIRKDDPLAIVKSKSSRRLE